MACLSFPIIAHLIQLQDAAKSKFAKCDHIDIDWGVSGEQEEDIYQTPILDSQPAPATSEQPLPPGSSNGTAIKHSASSGDIVGEWAETISQAGMFDVFTPSCVWPQLFLLFRWVWVLCIVSLCE